MKFPCIISLCFFIILSFCKAQENNEMARVAVLELVQYNDATSSYKELINKNLDRMENAADLAKKNGVQLLVLPEKAEYPTKVNPIWFLSYAEDVPDGSENVNPCNDEKFSDRPTLKRFSCIAQKKSLYLVASLIDVKKCEVDEKCESRTNKNSCVNSILKCPLTGKYYFNTAVVFDKEGTLLVRYYKRHPFTLTDIGITMPKYPQPGYFDTEFGKSSTFIGFDVLFNDTFKDIEDDPNTNFVSYVNWWFDNTPLFYFGVDIQQSWSIIHRRPVLSSNVHSPNQGSIGSGIYIPSLGPVVYSNNNDGRSKLLVSNIPTSSSAGSIDKESLNPRFYYIDDGNSVEELTGEEPRNFKEECGENVLGMNPTTPLTTNASLIDYRCKQTLVHQYTFVKLNKTEDNITLCSNNFCCSLEYKADSMNETFYFAVSGNPLSFYVIYKFGVQSCFLARCEDVKGEPCRNYLLKSHTKFQSVKIKGSFDVKIKGSFDGETIYPRIFDSDLRLTSVNEWYFDGKSQLSYVNEYGKNLLFLNLYRRIYNQDTMINVGKAINFILG